MVPVSGINPKILTWARETSGYSIHDVAKLFRKSKEIIEEWESGESAPTYAQLERLAYQIYKRPIALFFFPEPPEELDPKKSFRTLPEFEIENLSKDTRYALRLANAMQLALIELNEGRNPSAQKIFQDIRMTIRDDVTETASQIRAYLGVELKDQIIWKNNDDALRNWKQALEDKGIFIFKRSFKQKSISGFCFSDAEFPIIYLNNGTASTRQTFTIFHELSHILLNTNGITMRDDSYIDVLSGDEKGIEIYSNRFAAEFLVPKADFEQQLKIQESLTDQSINKIAKRYKVSREVILRKLLDMGRISKLHYERKAKEWTGDYEKGPKPSDGGNYYATQIVYLGEKFLKLAFSKYYQEKCTLEQLADYLNVKAKSIPMFEQAILSRPFSHDIRI
jgi:Zn-dependent peptidase ImmA (M78 family)